MKLKWSDDGMKSPVARANGLGSTHHGTGHWLEQRVTAIANFMLVLWMLCSVSHLVGADHATFTTWLSQPVNGILCVLFVLSTFYHAFLGLTVVVEDYVQAPLKRLLTVWALRLFFSAAAVASIFSVLKIAFTA